MSPSEPTSEELDRLFTHRLQERKLERRRGRFRDQPLPRETLLQMALAPAWTPRFARAAMLPSGDDAMLQEALARMRSAGLIDVAPPAREGGEEVYSMKGGARARFLEEYADGTRPVRELRTLLGSLGQLADERGGLDDLPPTARRWATLAANAADSAKMVADFDRQAEEALASKDPAGVLELVEAARPFAALLARDQEISLDLALQRASRRLELFYRREHDRRQLQFYFARDEHQWAFEELMNGPDDAWALHFIGAGGVGKTMLVRHLTAEVAPRPEWNLATARIDFDYLNADYPSLAPGLILWSFAQELRLSDETISGQALTAFGVADDVLRKLHDDLRADPRRASTTRATRAKGFRAALQLYIEGFRALGRRILLVVDTCEELAKTSPDGSEPLNVEETFRILRALHDGVPALDDQPVSAGNGVPNLRVIFSGRRPLASAGHGGWYVRSSPLPARPYLRLHELRGFTHREARKYLTTILPVPRDLIKPVIAQSSPEAGRVAGIEWRDEQARELARWENEGGHVHDEEPAPEEPRCNPYDLRLFADWARDDPPPSATELETASSDQYVEWRILRRLHNDPLERLMPTVALLGHFDRDMLREVCGGAVEISPDESEVLPSGPGGEESLRAVFDTLRQQEWINQRLVAIKEGREPRLVLSVEPGVRCRLLAYFQKQGHGLSQAQARAADYLERTTLQDDLSTLAWPTFDAALRVLELDPDPERVARWWSRVEKRIVDERGFRWALDLLAFLQGEDGAAGPRDGKSGKDPMPESRMRAAVRATYAAALLNTGQTVDLGRVWAEVAAKADRHPSHAGAERLRLRALCGIIGATPSLAPASQPKRERTVGTPSFWEAISLESMLQAFPEPTEPDLVTLFWQWLERLVVSPLLDAELSAALEAAMEAIVEYAEQVGRVQAKQILSTKHLAGLYTVTLATRGPGQQLSVRRLAFACALTARGLRLLGELADARDGFLAARQFVREMPPEDEPKVWADWLPPDDFAARVYLEYLRIGYPAFVPLGEALPVIDSLPTLQDNLDSERLHSLALRLRGHEGPVGRDLCTTYELAETELQVASRTERCNAQREVPPLFVAIAETHAANGNVEQALSLLRQGATETNPADVATRCHAERARLRIVRRMRLRSETRINHAPLAELPTRLEDQALTWTLDALDGRKNQQPIPSIAASGDSANRYRLHLLWQTRFLLDAGKKKEAIRWASENLPHLNRLVSVRPVNLVGAWSDFLQVALALDWQEACALGAGSSAVNFSPAEWLAEHNDQPAEALVLALRSEALRPPVPPEDPIWTGLTERLGVRRAAEIALAEGELLALRLPGNAARILTRAVAWFEQCADRVGAILAGTALALVQARLRNGPGLGETLARVENAYRGVAMDSPVPTWEVLTSLAEAPQEEALNTLGSDAWRPWLARILVCLLIQRDLSGAPPVPAVSSGQPFDLTVADEIQGDAVHRNAVAVLGRWLVLTYGTKVGERLELPGDLTDFFEGSVEAGMQLGLRPPQSWGRWLVDEFLPVVIGLGILAGMSIGGFFLYRWLAGQVTNVASWSLPAQIGSYCVAVPVVVTLIVVLTMSAPRVLAWFQLLAMSRTWVVVRLDFAEQEKSRRPTPVESAPIRVRLSRWEFAFFRRGTSNRSPFDLLRPVRVDLPEETAFLPAPGPYAHAAERLPHGLVAELERLQKALGRPGNVTQFFLQLFGLDAFEVILQLADGLHEPCWEGLFSLAVEKTKLPPVKPSLRFGAVAFPFRRETARRVAESRETDVAPIAVWVADETARGVAERGWAGLRTEVGHLPPQSPVRASPEPGDSERARGGTFPFHVLRGVSPEERAETRPDIRILHLFGWARELSGAVRFQVASGADLREAESWQMSAPEALVTADELRRAFPDLTVCIVQGPPDRPAAQRLESDRHLAGLSRRFASDLFAKGVPIVLTLPPLEPNLAVSTLGFLPEVFRRPRRRGTRAMRQAVADMRDHIAAVVASPRDPAAVEAAYDVCLYAIRYWDARLSRGAGEE